MKIIDIICSQGKTGFYFDDQRAIKNGAKSDGFTYIGDVITRLRYSSNMYLLRIIATR